MENNSKITSSFFIFISIYFGINTSTIMLTSLIMKDFKQSAWIVPLITFIPLLLLTFLYKPTKFKKEIEKNIFFKIIMLINGLLNTIVLIYVTSLMLGHAFFKISSTTIFLFILSIIIIILSFGNLYKIIRLGLILVIGSLIFIPFFIDLEPVNQPILDIFPKTINFSIFKGLYFASLINEIFLFTIYNNDYNKPIMKKDIIISGSIILIIVSLHIIDSYTIVNYRYYDEIKILSFNRYFSHKGRRFFEHLDILLLYILLSTTIFKGSLYLTYSKHLFMKVNKYYFMIIYLIILLSFLITLQNQENLLNTIIYISNFISFIYVILIIYYSRRIKNVRNIKTTNSNIR